MKVLLINPPADNGVRQVREGRCMQRAGAWTGVWTPLSLAYCAAVLRDAGFIPRLVDCIAEDISFGGVERIAQEFMPDIAVLNAATPSIYSDILITETLRKACPNIKTAAIGIHGSALPEDTLNMSNCLDFVVRREPERTVENLCKAISAGKRPDAVPGVSLKAGEGFIHNPDSEFIQDLDLLPFPAYDLIKTEKYIMPLTKKRFLLIGTGRGCGHSCVFCADHVYYGKKVRLRKPSAVVTELEFWKNSLCIRDFLFWTESFTLRRSFCAELAEEIMLHGMDIEWVCNSRADNLDMELLSLFRRAGCTTVGLGIESGSDQILKKMNKGLTTGQIKEAVAMCRRAGLDVVAHTIVGFPGETKADILGTIRFLKSLGVDFAQFYCAVPFPGSALYGYALSKGWLSFTDWRKFEQNVSVLTYDEMTPRIIMRLRKRAYLSFYLRPVFAFKTLIKIVKRGGIGKMPRAAIDFLSWL